MSGSRVRGCGSMVRRFGGVIFEGARVGLDGAKVRRCDVRGCEREEISME